MNKTLLATLFTTAVLLSACGKDGDFKSAINKSIQGNYSCLNLISPLYVPWMDNKELEQYKRENSFVLVDVMKDGKIYESSPNSNGADALVKAGLLTKTTKTEHAIGVWDKKPIKGTIFTINLYNFTDAGKQTIKTGPGDFKYTFCYAHPEVDSILNYTEQDLSGQKIVEVKYSFKYVDVADWVSKTEIKAAFPEIEKKLDNSDKTDRIVLIKTNNGWQTNL